MVFSAQRSLGKTPSEYVQVNTVWPGGCKKGELTWVGQQQSRELGKWLRQRYVQQIPFLPDDYRASFHHPRGPQRASDLPVDTQTS